MTFELARTVADAVLFEGYLLYPYRASAQKNQLRWQFGVLVPPAYHAADPSEPWSAQTECLVESGTTDTTRLQVRLRCLQVQPRDGADLDEGELREVDTAVALAEPLVGEQVVPFSFSDAVSGRLVLTADRLDGPYGVVKLRVRVENTTPWDQPGAGRNEALRHSLVATHTLLAVSDGAFISLLEPPEWARPAAMACVNERTWPVLVGEPGSRGVMLSSPIILYDYPRLAPESPGDLFDGTEIDEILTLRTMALTDAEKREARATDPRAAALIDRVDDMPPELLERLHGAVRYVDALRPTTPSSDPPRQDPLSLWESLRANSPRESPPSALRGARVRATPEPEPVPWWDPGADTSVSPETDSLLIGESVVSKGSRVRLAPGRRRADAQDMFLVGRTARVEGVFLDVDGARYLAVTLEDDPAADLHQAHGRFLYFHPDEVEPLESSE